MESERFDRLTRAWSTHARRRTLAGALLFGTFGLAGTKETAVQARKGKKVTLCLAGQTLLAMKSKKGKLLKQGATLGACAGSPPVSPPASPPLSPPPPPPPPSRPTCTDGIKNGQETDIDCGGPRCPSCEINNGCLRDDDCRSGLCSAGKRCVRCTNSNECGFDSAGDCFCDAGTGQCLSDSEPVKEVANCAECGNLACVERRQRLVCIPTCASSEICRTQDDCTTGDAYCGNIGVCLQPIGGGSTQCGVSAGQCGCAGHQECVDEFGEGAYCVQFNPAFGRCTCGPGSPLTTFCAVPR